MTAPATFLHIHKQDYFHRAAAAYEEAALAYRVEQEEAAEARVRVYALRDELADLEAEAIVNGGVGDCYVTATTAEKRKAQLRLALSKSPEYQALAKRLRDEERRLSQAEIRRDAAANQMSLAKRRMDSHVANVARQTAILSNRGAGEPEDHAPNYAGK